MSSRPNFAVLENVGTGAGAPWHLVAEGDAAAGKNAGASLVARDELGNLQYLRTRSSDGRLLIDAEGDDVVDLDDVGENAGSGTFVDLLTIALQNSFDYKNFEFVFSCFRDATFEIVQIDNVGVTDDETIIATVKVGSGQFTSTGKLTRRITTPGANTSQIRVRAVNQNVTSQLEASLSFQEVQ